MCGERTMVSPAHAGMYPATHGHPRSTSRFPRTRGDVPGQVGVYANLTVALGQIPSQDVGREHGGLTADGHVD